MTSELQFTWLWPRCVCQSLQVSVAWPAGRPWTLRPFLPLGTHSPLTRQGSESPVHLSWSKVTAGSFLTRPTHHALSLDECLPNANVFIHVQIVS